MYVVKKFLKRNKCGYRHNYFIKIDNKSINLQLYNSENETFNSKSRHISVGFHKEIELVNE